MTRTLLLITNDFPPMAGGEAVWYARMCTAAVRRGPAVSDRVLVLAPKLRGDVAFDARQPYSVIRRRVPVSTHPAARLWQLLLLGIAAFGIVRRERVRMVHIGHLYLGPIALALKALRNIPYVLYLHGGEMAPYMRFRLIRRVAEATVRNAHVVVMNSGFTRRHFASLGISHPHVEIVAPPVDIERFQPGIDTAAVRRRYGIDGQKVLLTVGRLVTRKGHDTVIRVLPRLRKEVGPVRYLIAGAGPDEPRLRALARETGCDGEVVFVGPVPDEHVPGLYAACDVFVMPNRSLDERDGVEGFGLVFLEAGASGKPAIGGRSGGVEDAVLDGKTGILVDPLDLDGLSEALLRVLRDPGLSARLGAEGRRRAAALASASAAALARVWAADLGDRDTPDCRAQGPAHAR
ncbi:MAG TPA: glycosyltransferase family 4 protein [bacterium]|nr:glycosyltransferase family 4 protein [bacterium]